MRMVFKIPGEEMKIALMGDVMIGRLVDEHLRKASPSSIWGNALPLLSQTDLRIINLETTLTTSDDIAPKVFNFRAHPSRVQSLVDAHIDVANLANNHTLDYGLAGFLETIYVLDQAGIAHCGAGKNLDQAKSPVIIERRGIKIGFLGMTDNEPDWVAGQHKPGTRYIQVGDIDEVRSDIRMLAQQVDIIIVSIHWGPNMQERPSPTFKRFAHELIDAGAHVIHGHSAHIFQGVEQYRHGLILYDTGDFIDDYYVDPVLRNDRSFLFVVSVNKNGIDGLSLVPVLISNFQVNLAINQDFDETVKRMQDLAGELGSQFELRQTDFHLVMR